MSVIKLKIPRTKENLLVRQFYCLMQPNKRKIVEILTKSKKPLYIREIAKKLKLTHRTTSYHLLDLMEFGFVAFVLGENKTNRMSKYYKVTPKVYKVKQKIIKELSK